MSSCVGQLPSSYIGSSQGGNDKPNNIVGFYQGCIICIQYNKVAY